MEASDKAIGTFTAYSSTTIVVIRLSWNNISTAKQRVQQLTGDDGSFLPNGKLLCLWKYKTIETVYQGQ